MRQAEGNVELQLKINNKCWTEFQSVFSYLDLIFKAAVNEYIIII